MDMSASFKGACGCRHGLILAHGDFPANAVREDNHVLIFGISGNKFVTPQTADVIRPYTEKECMKKLCTVEIHRPGVFPLDMYTALNYFLFTFSFNHTVEIEEVPDTFFRIVGICFFVRLKDALCNIRKC